MKPIVAIVGLPNVGKSTLFNRIIGQRKAITDEIAGTTRDRLYGEFGWGGQKFILVDTAGADYEDKSLGLKEQIQIAIDEADLILFVVEPKQSDDAALAAFSKQIHMTNKAIFLIINKCDNPRFNISDFSKLGFKKIFKVSALNGTGTGDLLDEINKLMSSISSASEQNEQYRKIAIVGRPNVGKSTLINTLLGSKRVLVSEKPGTTRDNVDIPIEIISKTHIQKHLFILIDTPGIRRAGRRERVEKFGFIRTLKSIEEADIIFLLADACEGVVRGDAHIASFVLERKKELIILINKIDFCPISDHKKFLSRFPFMEREWTFPISAKNGEGLEPVIEAILNIVPSSN